VEDGVLCKVLQNNFTVSLNEEESQAHKRFCEQIKEIKKRIINNNIMRMDKDKINRGNIAYLLEIRRKLLIFQERNSDLSQETWDLIKKIDMLNTLYINRRRLFNKAEQKWELLIHCFQRDIGCNYFPVADGFSFIKKSRSVRELQICLKKSLEKKRYDTLLRNGNGGTSECSP